MVIYILILIAYMKKYRYKAGWQKTSYVCSCGHSLFVKSNSFFRGSGNKRRPSYGKYLCLVCNSVFDLEDLDVSVRSKGVGRKKR